MNNIIVDANILFSGILCAKSQIGKLLLTSRQFFQFYATEFLRQEIEYHKTKLVEISELPPAEVDLLTSKFFQRVTFVPEASIPFEVWQKCAVLVRDIDPDDIAYVALTEFIDGRLWTGDIKLRKGLITKGYTKCITTKDLLQWRSELWQQRKAAKK